MQNTQPYSAAVPVGFAITAFAIAAITFLVPTPPDTVNPVAAHWRAAAATLPAFLLIGSAYVFLGGLRSFKAGRSAYRLLAISMLVLSVLFIQVTIWGLFDMWDSAWAASGSGLIPLALTTVLTHLGTRKFAHLLQVKTIFSSTWFTILVSSILGGIMAFLATRIVQYDIPGTEIYIGVCSWGAAYMTSAAIMMHRVANAIGASYRRAMYWLMVSIGAFALASWHEAISTLWFNNGSRYTDYGFYLLPFVATGFVMLYAGYQFRKVTAFVRNDEVPDMPVTDSDYIDSIVAIAGLASRPEDVDGILDDLREITATRQPDEPLQALQREQLLHIYHRLEDYLSHHDPLRTVSREELLSRVTPGFRKLLEHAA